MTNLDNRVMRTQREGVNWIRGINNTLGTNLAGGSTGGFGQIANNKKFGLGDAFNVATTLAPEIMAPLGWAAKILAKPITGLATSRLEAIGVIGAKDIGLQAIASMGAKLGIGSLLRESGSAVLPGVAADAASAVTKALMPGPKPPLMLGRGTSISVAARGTDLLEMINSGQINSSLAKGSGYISNQDMLSGLGIVNEGYGSYNATRAAMESVTGVLRGNSNYGYARLADDFETASQYTRFRVNMLEHGELIGNPAGARITNVQHEFDHLMGAAYVNLKPNPAMTYTVGDSWNMYIRGLLSQSNPAKNIPMDINSIPLAGIRGENVLEAAGAYTEVQFPNIPFNSSTIESVTLLRNKIIGKAGDITSQGWGGEYQRFITPQEQLVMQRMLAQKLSNLGIKVQTGIDDIDIAKIAAGGGVSRMQIFDDVPLHKIPQNKFDEMLMSMTREIKSAEQAALAEEARYAASRKLFRSVVSLAPIFGFGGLGALTATRDRNIPKFKTGGYVPGSPSMAIPALLHGGEYVVNADAVRNMGVRTMQSINQSKFRTPSSAPSYMGGGQTTNVSTVNINVDTFVGEEEWFKSMMKSYNVNVLPKQQKAAGMETRTFTSYNGINQGL
jgi:hypothetical protein